MAAAAACGVVAFESLYQSTPSSVPTQFQVVRRPDEVPKAAGHGVDVGQPGFEHERRCGQGVGDVVGQLAPSASSRRDHSPRGPDQRRAVGPVVRLGAAEGALSGRRRRDGHDDRVVGEADRHVVAVWFAKTCAFAAM